MKIRIFFYRYKIGRDAVFARYCSKSPFSKGEAVFRVPFSHYEASRKSERAPISLRQFSSGGGRAYYARRKWQKPSYKFSLATIIPLRHKNNIRLTESVSIRNNACNYESQLGRIIPLWIFSVDLAQLEAPYHDRSENPELLNSDFIFKIDNLKLFAPAIFRLLSLVQARQPRFFA